MSACAWVGSAPIYIEYHDTEWGVPEWDSRALWEKLMLDGFQAGLSWITILKKRENFRSAFRGFVPEQIAAWGRDDVARLLNDPGIVRHRGKIEATIGNARAYLSISEQQSFSDYLWGFVDGVPIQNSWRHDADVPATTPVAEALSKDLRARGFKFCGPTIVYAAMQATGMVNDHVVSCPRHAACARMVTR